MRRSHFYLLVLVLIIATFLRLYHITTTPPGLYPDEAMNGNNALETLSTTNFSVQGGPASGWKVFYPENNGREGLFMNIQALSLMAFGVNEPWVLRFPSTLFGIFTVLGIYFLARELFGKEVALLAAFLLATNFWHIMFSRIGFRAIMAPFFIIWALFFLLKTFNRIRNDSRMSIVNGQLSIVAGVLFGLGMYSYIAYRVTPVLILLVMLFYFAMSRREKWRGAFFRAALCFSIATIVTVAPLAAYYIQHPEDFLGRTSQVSVFASETPIHDLAWNTVKTLGMFNIVGDWNQRHNEGGRPALFWPVGLMFLIGAVVAIKNMINSKSEALNSKQSQNSNIENMKHGGVLNFKNWGLFRNSDFWFMILVVWFLLAMAPVVISNEGLPHALRSILLIPPTIILAAAGGVAIYGFLKKFIRASRLKPLAAILLVLLVAEAYSTYFVVWANNPKTPEAFAADYVALGKRLNAIPAEIPKYVIVEAGGVLVRGIPMPSQTVMFITDTFTPEKQAANNIRYILPGDEDTIPSGALIFRIK
ncbi:MAG: hypothetical protein A2945_01225 [Candidatus Liptonbacteria bacterium RIFCSPLOWO2_01_FULL_52_25]|uniref:Glycosyltransferase RgtA/B/C/D-like domain-containing protein n=1 Tax=Candidatus Liptonbacteria bacterium RIFCSPLOWO2_01_FULL_52_25 TaxID=1798650 RepID=A0A1G2CE30_9BACT|nr:MAG: hypothetical protein A2945_01225 [Candidatus Liptonbacteria bacterium RIFCSPLOWO2_01_FULL_52_25]